MVYLRTNMVKYGVTEKLWEIMNTSFSVFHHFTNIHLYSVKFETIWFIGIQFRIVR